MVHLLEASVSGELSLLYDASLFSELVKPGKSETTPSLQLDGTVTAMYGIDGEVQD